MSLKRLLIGGTFLLSAWSIGAQNMLFSDVTFLDSVEYIEYRKEVEILLELSGTQSAIETMIPAMKEMFQPNIVEGGGREQAYRLMDELFDDLKGLNEFYRTPLGQKFASTASELTTEALRAGQRYAQLKMAEIAEKLKEKKLLKGI